MQDGNDWTLTVFHDKSTNYLTERPVPGILFEDRQVRYMDGTATTQIEMTVRTVMVLPRQTRWFLPGS